MSEPNVDTDLTLGPATRMLWRTPDSIQLELGDAAVVVEGLPTQLIKQVASPLPRTRPPALVPSGTGAAIPDALARLTEAGYLWARPAEAEDPRHAATEPRLAGELAALAIRHGEQGAQVLRARRDATVVLHGTSRVATHIGALLAAAGVGRVRCAMDGRARLTQAVPGGLTCADEGTESAAASHAALLRAAPSVDTTPLPPGEEPDLEILALDAPMSDERLDALHAARTPYLVVEVDADWGSVGPLVLPGLTACPRCADCHRADRDPAWAALAVQLTVGRRYGPASSVTIATVIAGVAAQHALGFLDGDGTDCIEATIEWRLPDWRLRRRSRPAHPDCGCTGLEGAGRGRDAGTAVAARSADGDGDDHLRRATMRLVGHNDARDE